MFIPDLRYEDVTADAFKALAVKVKEKTGVSMDADSGEDGEKGYHLAWSWSPATEVLTVRCKEKPWYVPMKTVASVITDFVDEAKAETKTA